MCGGGGGVWYSLVLVCVCACAWRGRGSLILVDVWGMVGCSWRDGWWVGRESLSPRALLITVLWSICVPHHVMCIYLLGGKGGKANSVGGKLAMPHTGLFLWGANIRYFVVSL